MENLENNTQENNTQENNAPEAQETPKTKKSYSKATQTLESFTGDKNGLKAGSIVNVKNKDGKMVKAKIGRIFIIVPEKVEKYWKKKTPKEEAVLRTISGNKRLYRTLENIFPIEKKKTTKTTRKPRKPANA